MSRLRLVAPAATGSSSEQVFTKTYQSEAARERAAAHYGWLTACSPPLRLPRLLGRENLALRFEWAPGTHVRQVDLVAVSAHLGQAHAHAHQACLSRTSAGESFGFRAEDGTPQVIPGFLEGRLEAVPALLTAGSVPEPVLTPKEARKHLMASVDEPAAFYKDANPRNLLLTDASQERVPITVDFDDLTLAPFGYDLAKLVVGLSMTHGRLPDSLIGAALHAYNRAVSERAPQLRPVTATTLLIWAEVHHVLTSRYVGRHGYRHSWHRLRPGNIGPS